MITMHACIRSDLNNYVHNKHAENNRPMLNCYSAYCSTDYSRSSLAIAAADIYIYIL
jgi:hypothetical protein